MLMLRGQTGVTHIYSPRVQEESRQSPNKQGIRCVQGAGLGIQVDDKVAGMQTSREPRGANLRTGEAGRGALRSVETLEMAKLLRRSHGATWGM